MSDPFSAKYRNPRTGNVSSGGAASEGRIKTLGGVDRIISDAVTKAILPLLTTRLLPLKLVDESGLCRVTSLSSRCRL